MTVEFASGVTPATMFTTGPVTKAVRQALDTVRDHSVISDLLFLERWEMAPMPGAAAALRVVQIRRANPALAAAVRAEVNAAR